MQQVIKDNDWFKSDYQFSFFFNMVRFLLVLFQFLYWNTLFCDKNIDNEVICLCTFITFVQLLLLYEQLNNLNYETYVHTCMSRF